MIEVFAVVALLLVFAAVGWTSVLWGWDGVVALGFGFVALGFIWGVPTGLLYHWHLYHMLSGRGMLPLGWYWNPIQLHGRLLEHERDRVIPWAIAGGLGFVSIVIGILVTVAGLVGYY